MNKEMRPFRPEVEINKYLDMAFTDAFSAPRESLQGSGLSQGLRVVHLSAYQAEVLAKAKHIYKEEEFKEYKSKVSVEEKRLVDEASVENKPLEPEMLKTMLAYYRIGLVLERIQAKKPDMTEGHL